MCIKKIFEAIFGKGPAGSEGAFSEKSRKAMLKNAQALRDEILADIRRKLEEFKKAARGREQALWVFRFSSADLGQEFDAKAHDHVADALDAGKIPVVVIAAPEGWADGDGWYNVTTIISRHAQYMRFSYENEIMSFGNRCGLSFEDIATLKAKEGIEFPDLKKSDIPEGFRMVILCEYYEKWVK